MSEHESDAVFAGSVPEIYDWLLVPLIFEPYAADLMQRLQRLGVGSVLEVGAGSGVVTRAMARGLGPDVQITATDLNQAMIDHAMALGTDRPVRWQSADVMALPFDDETFDAVVCQFAVMFFPDRQAAFAEIRRVLRPTGVFIFNVWDRIETNELADEVTRAVGTLFPDDPPLFLPRTPHGYYDEAEIQADVDAGGFPAPASFETVDARSCAETAAVPAVAYCQGTPLRNEIEARGATRLEEATAAAAAAVGTRWGQRDIDAGIRGHVITATKSRRD